MVLYETINVISIKEINKQIAYKSINLEKDKLLYNDKYIIYNFMNDVAAI